MIYTLHLPANAAPVSGDDTGESRFDGLIAIPESNAKWALIFAPFWLVRHRLWFEFAIYALFVVLSFGLLATPYAVLTLLLSGLPGIYLFFEGHQLRRNKLERHGYKTVGVVHAGDERHAIERFLADWRAPTSAPAKSASQSMPSLAKRDDDDLAFGLFADTAG